MEDWTATKAEYGYWLYTWTAGPTDVFTIWFNGKQLDTVTGDEFKYGLDGYVDAPPSIEVVAESDDAENHLYPPYAVIQWREASYAVAYRVEMYVDSAWVIKKTVGDNGSGWYWYRTPVLGDQTSVQYRVSGLNQQGTAGTPIAFTFSIEHNPATPDVVYTIDGSNDLVVSEA